MPISVLEVSEVECLEVLPLLLNTQRGRSYEYNLQPSTTSVNNYQRQQNNWTTRSRPSTRSRGKFYYNSNSRENVRKHHVRYFDQKNTQVQNTAQQINHESNINRLEFFRP